VKKVQRTEVHLKSLRFAGINFAGQEKRLQNEDASFNINCHLHSFYLPKKITNSNKRRLAINHKSQIIFLFLYRDIMTSIERSGKTISPTHSAHK
jgi:hypothetical protein